MSRSEGEHAADTIRARRVEIVDTRGRVRGVLGSLESPDHGEEVMGFALYDDQGGTRASLALDGDAAWISLELGGNLLVHLGVNGPASDALDARAFLHLADSEGRSVIGWTVTDDGGLVERRKD